jgi:hypothetical protein
VTVALARYGTNSARTRGNWHDICSNELMNQLRWQAFNVRTKRAKVLPMEPDIGEPLRRHEVVPLNEPVVNPEPPDLPVVPTKVPAKEPA